MENAVRGGFRSELGERVSHAKAAGATEKTSARVPIPDIQIQIRNFIDFLLSWRWPIEEEANRDGVAGCNEEGVKAEVKFW